MLEWLQENGLIVVIVCMGVLIFCILLFSYLNDREVNKRLDKFGIAIDDLHDEIYKIQKRIKTLDEGQEERALEVMAQIKAQTQNVVDDSLNQAYQQLEGVEQRMAEKIRLTADSLSALDVKMRELGCLFAGSSSGTDEKKILQFIQEGKSVDFIARELGITRGEVELFLQLADISYQDQKKEK